MRFLMTLILATMVGSAYAQNSLLKFTDYTMAQPLINPAAMGQETGVNGMTLYRSSFDGRALTGAFNINTLFPDKDLGGGITLLFNNEGPRKTMIFYIAGTYRLKLDDGKLLYFGLQAGINHEIFDKNKYNPSDDGDEVLLNIENSSKPNFGFGLHYKAEKYFAGFSIPEFRYNPTNSGDQASETMSELMRIHLYGGMNFKIGKESELMPYTYIVYSEVEGVVMDMGARLTFKGMFQFGLQYRTKESFAVTARVKVLKNIWLGYSFENSTSTLGNPQEIGLTFRFGKDSKKSSSDGGDSYDDDIRSIRYF